MAYSGPGESIDTIAHRTVYTRPNPVITDWLELLGMDSTRFDLARPGARMLVAYILTIDEEARPAHDHDDRRVLPYTGP